MANSVVRRLRARSLVGGSSGDRALKNDNSYFEVLVASISASVRPA
ncbi:MAG: hypothetical protein AAGB13_06185 [Cyanobacteria bacterium P01_F01_bin.33]